MVASSRPDRFNFVYKDDRVKGAVALTGTALDTEIDVYVGLGVTLLDCAALAAGDTGSTQHTGVGNNIWHGRSTSS
jgi:hypothetical protein